MASKGNVLTKQQIKELDQDEVDDDSSKDVEAEDDDDMKLFAKVGANLIKPTDSTDADDDESAEEKSVVYQNVIRNIMPA
jgi:hypothetical protein